MSLNASSDDYFDKVVELVSLEPSYAGRLLVAANSAENRGAQPIRNIRDAVVRLGAKRVSGLIVSMSVVRVFVPRTPLQRSLWLHAVEVACGARHLAQISGDPDIDPEQCYLAGLMHDLGHYVLLEASPEELARIEEMGWETPAELVGAEKEALGWDHTEVGALAAERWGLPEVVQDSVRYHHSLHIEALLSQQSARVTQIVQLADVTMFGVLRGDDTPFEDDRDAQKRLRSLLPSWFARLTPRAIQRFAVAEAEARVAAEVLGL